MASKKIHDSVEAEEIKVEEIKVEEIKVEENNIACEKAENHSYEEELLFNSKTKEGYIINEDLITRAYIPELLTEKYISDTFYVVNVDNSQFVLFKGLLDIAHKYIGIKSMDSEIVKLDTANKIVVIKATVVFSDGSSFSAYGDADSENIDDFVALHYIRVAETRAFARALRIGLNVGMTARDELGKSSKKVRKQSKNTDTVATNDISSEIHKISESNSTDNVTIASDSVTPATLERMLRILNTDKRYEAIEKFVKEQLGKSSISSITEKEALSILEKIETKSSSK